MQTERLEARICFRCCIGAGVVVPKHRHNIVDRNRVKRACASW